jgi:hypothetical protein
VFHPTIVQVQLDVDIVVEENEEFYIEILADIDKHHHEIPLMDILDRITTTKNVFFFYTLHFPILTDNTPGRNNLSHCNDRLLVI